MCAFHGRHEEQELVATDASKHVRRADVANHALSDLDEQRVPDCVAIVVVNVLEVVGEGEMAVRFGKNAFQPLLDEAAIG